MIEIYNSQIYEIVTGEIVGEIDNLKEKNRKFGWIENEIIK